MSERERTIGRIREINQSYASEQRRTEEKVALVAELLGMTLDLLEQIVELGQERDSREYLAESVAIYGGPSERFDAALHKGGRP